MQRKQVVWKIVPTSSNSQSYQDSGIKRTDYKLNLIVDYYFGDKQLDVFKKDKWCSKGEAVNNMCINNSDENEKLELQRKDQKLEIKLNQTAKDISH